MVEIHINLDFDRSGLEDAIAGQFEQQIQTNGIDCPKEGCESEEFNAKIWTNQQGRFEGAAVCSNCDSKINLDINDTDMQQTLSKIDSLVDDIENSFS